MFSLEENECLLHKGVGLIDVEGKRLVNKINWIFRCISYFKGAESNFFPSKISGPLGKTKQNKSTTPTIWLKQRELNAQTIKGVRTSRLLLKWGELMFHKRGGGGFPISEGGSIALKKMREFKSHSL